jgi:hypothetical protein
MHLIVGGGWWRVKSAVFLLAHVQKKLTLKLTLKQKYKFNLVPGFQKSKKLWATRS